MPTLFGSNASSDSLLAILYQNSILPDALVPIVAFAAATTEETLPGSGQARPGEVSSD